jgi:hypothetical protein
MKRSSRLTHSLLLARWTLATTVCWQAAKAKAKAKAKASKKPNPQTAEIPLDVKKESWIMNNRQRSSSLQKRQCSTTERPEWSEFIMISALQKQYSTVHTVL